jgi:uncharacterized protein YndB with AHSA1/START domain
VYNSKSGFLFSRNSPYALFYISGKRLPVICTKNIIFIIYLKYIYMEPANMISVSTTVKAPLEKVWHCWSNPEDIMQWNSASSDWHTPAATVDLREGGNFSLTMAAIDGSMSFEFGGHYTKVIPQERIEFMLDDGRSARVLFETHDGQTTITESFTPETENPIPMQQMGWQAILDHFKTYTETKP